MDNHINDLPRPRASFWEWIARLSELITIVKFAYSAWKWTRRRNIRLPALRLPTLKRHPFSAVIVVGCLVAILAMFLPPSSVTPNPAPLISSETHSTETFVARASTSGTLHMTGIPGWAVIALFVIIPAGLFAKDLAPLALRLVRHRRRFE